MAKEVKTEKNGKAEDISEKSQEKPGSGKNEIETVFISEADQYLFSQGTHYDIYKKLGAHVSWENGETGIYFGVWAPNAQRVHVVGTFNGWGW